jgi:peptidoglycan hydrolase-like protein with peptidoglycan-binding domain
MKRTLLSVLVVCGAVTLAHADPGIRSLQQTLKSQGFYYGAITGDKNAETTTAIRRYQIRKGLQVTGELNEETSRSINSSSKYVASTAHTTLKPTEDRANSVRADASPQISQSSPAPSFRPPEHRVQNNPSYATSFYQSAPLQVNRDIIARVQYQLMSRGYYRGRVDGKYGRQMSFALRTYQSRAGLVPTGRLDKETLDALRSSAESLVDSAPTSGGYEAWMPVRKFKNGKWKVKWKRNYQAFDGENSNEDPQPNTQSRLNLYQDY